jgi:hypothetical protein
MKKKHLIILLIVIISTISFFAGLLIPVKIPLHKQRVSTKEDICRNKLSSILFALRNYHDDYGTFPPPITLDANGKPFHSWRALILPYLEFYDYDFTKSWDTPNNLLLNERVSPIYRCPYESRDAYNTSYFMLYNENTHQNIESGSYGLIIEIHNSEILCLEPKDLTLSDINAEIRKSDNQVIKYIPERLHYSQEKGVYFHIGMVDMTIKTIPYTIEPSELMKILGIPSCSIKNNGGRQKLDQ